MIQEYTAQPGSVVGWQERHVTAAGVATKMTRWGDVLAVTDKPGRGVPCSGTYALVLPLNGGDPFWSLTSDFHTTFKA